MHDRQAISFRSRRENADNVEYFHGTANTVRPESRRYDQGGVSAYVIVCRYLDGRHMCPPGQCPNEVAIAFDGDGEMFLTPVEPDTT